MLVSGTGAKSHENLKNGIVLVRDWVRGRDRFRGYVPMIFVLLMLGWVNIRGKFNVIGFISCYSRVYYVKQRVKLVMAIDVNKPASFAGDEFSPLTQNMTIAETERLIIRPLSLSDTEMILVLLNEPAFIKNIADKGVRNLNDAKDYIINGPWAMHELHGFSLYCCQRKCDGKTIGLSGLFKREGVTHPEVAFAFLEKYCRQGYGFESVSAVIEYARETLQLKLLQAITNTNNQGSIKLLEKSGFNFLNVMKLPTIDTEINLFELALE